MKCPFCRGRGKIIRLTGEGVEPDDPVDVEEILLGGVEVVECPRCEGRGEIE
jgi:hypothetical protein